MSGPVVRAPTILQLAPRLNAGGVERGVIEIVEAISIAGGRAMVASEGGRLEPALLAAGGELVRMPAASKNPLILRANAKRLVNLIERENIKLLHARSRAPAWSAYWAARRTKTPFITTYHGVYNENLPLKRKYNAIMTKGDLVIAVSNYIADLIQKRHHTSPDKIVVIHRGADLQVFSEMMTSISRVSMLARHWGVFEEERPILLFPGRLTRWKGHTLLLEALAQVRSRRGDDALLAILVGGEEKGGRFRSELEKTIAAENLGAMVKMVGHCDDMPAAYRLSSIVASASLEPEPFGRTTVEAMAMGAPVIAPAHGGALETVADGETGWLFGPGEAESLAMAIEHALDVGAAARKAIGAAGVARVREYFSVAKMQAATIEVYQQVLAEHEHRQR